MCGWLRRIGPVRLRCAQSRLRRFQSGGDRFVVSCSLNISNLIVCTSFADVQKKVPNYGWVGVKSPKLKHNFFSSAMWVLNRSGGRVGCCLGRFPKKSRFFFWMPSLNRKVSGDTNNQQVYIGNQTSRAKCESASSFQNCQYVLLILVDWYGKVSANTAELSETLSLGCPIFHFFLNWATPY